MRAWCPYGHKQAVHDDKCAFAHQMSNADKIQLFGSLAMKMISERVLYLILSFCLNCCIYSNIIPMAVF